MAKETKSQKKTTSSAKKTTTKSTKNTAANKNKSATTKNNAKKTASVKTAKNDTKVKSASVKNVNKENGTKPVVTTVNVKKENNGKLAKCKNCISTNWKEKREFSVACIIILILAVIIVILAISKRVPKLKDGSQVLASVDDYKVTSDDLYLDLKDEYGDTQLLNLIDSHISNDYVKKFSEEDNKYVDQVVDYYKQYAEYYGTDFETFLSSYVGITGVTNEDEFREYVKKDYKKTLAVQKYVGSTIKESELKQEFEENYKEKLTVRHILIEINDETSEDAAKKKAEDLIKELDKVKDDSKKLEDKFKDLAYDNSDDKATYEDGGLYKDFSKSDTDENFYKATKDLKNGEYTSKPVKSSYGYHVILRVSSKTNKYKDVKEKIRTDLAKSKLSEDSTLQVTAWDKLRKKYNLKINDTDMKKAYQKSVKDASETKEDKKSTDSDENSQKTEETKKED